MKCSDLINELENFAPMYLAENWDNIGLILGDTENDIKKILVALDATEEVINEAIAVGADIIITHHPMIFSGVKKITNQTAMGVKIRKLIKNNIAHFAMHTNLDIAFGGTNDELARIAGLNDIEVLRKSCQQDGKDNGLGRIGNLKKETNFRNFARILKKELNLDTLRVVGDTEKIVKRVGLCTGSGFEFMEDAIEKGADVYITGDLRYHESQKAQDAGICVIDVTHYAGENIIVPVICRYLNGLEKGIEVIQTSVDGQVFTEL
ncbi:MAG TPA: Nif3-like dinuclear metal center hexameric protein [Lachnospiraceae bacterium]|nr:Nif3-like dinuclear metal center hexameric protein [Lachnospiraceae bacterium]